MPRLARIRVHPIKSLDPHELDSVSIVENGGLEHDREFAIFDADGEYVNGKREPKVHRLRTEFDPDRYSIRVRVEGGGEEDWREFDLDDDRATLSAWLSDYVGFPVEMRRETAGGFPDNATSAPGPTVISTATLQEVASWYPEIDVAEMRRRMRATLEVEGVPAFWEDRLVANEAGVRFRIGDVVLEGAKPVPRCVVPTRDPWTGRVTDGFRERFVTRREETFPDWAPRDRFEHLYCLMVGTRVPESEWGGDLHVGDEVALLG